MADIAGDGAPFDRLVATPKYGENPWQGDAGLFADSGTDDPLSIANFLQLQGDKVSYNNYVDTDRLLQTATHIAAVLDLNYGEVPAIALGAKHGNVCGAAASASPEEALRKMLEGDQIAIFGGAVAVNFDIDDRRADILMTHDVESGKRLLDVIAAPHVTDDALQKLQRKTGKLRVLTNAALLNLDQDSLDYAQRFRYVRGGVLVQNNYDFVVDMDATNIEVRGDLDERQEKDLLLAWAVGSTSNSNTITLVKDGMLIANGVGQQDRVGAAKLAVARARAAGHSTEGTVAYSDSFFPFPDGPGVLIDAGVEAILTSRGSKNDQEVLGAIEKAGVTLVTVPDAEGRGFYGH